MLQQTQVDTVLRYYPAFLERFPNIQALAKAHLDEVLALWAGLGYYRRARLMHKAARMIMEKHGGIFPSRFTEIVALPGVGRSTAGAIASIAFGARTPVLDGNVRRVLVRWAGQMLPEAELWTQAQALVDAAPDPGDWNQALMELGAVLCLPKTTRCEACPVASACRARAPIPWRKPRRPNMQDMHLRVRIHVHPARGVWLVRQPEDGIWGGLWTPPLVETAPPARSPDHLHLLTHRRVHLYAEALAEPQGEGRWSREHKLAVPSGIQVLLRKMGVWP